MREGGREGGRKEGREGESEGGREGEREGEKEGLSEPSQLKKDLIRKPWLKHSQRASLLPDAGTHNCRSGMRHLFLFLFSFLFIYYY